MRLTATKATFQLLAGQVLQWAFGGGGDLGMDDVAAEQSKSGLNTT